MAEIKLSALSHDHYEEVTELVDGMYLVVTDDEATKKVLASSVHVTGGVGGLTGTGSVDGGGDGSAGGENDPVGGGGSSGGGAGYDYALFHVSVDPPNYLTIFDPIDPNVTTRSTDATTTPQIPASSGITLGFNAHYQSVSVFPDKYILPGQKVYFEVIKMNVADVFLAFQDKSFAPLDSYATNNYNTHTAGTSGSYQWGDRQFLKVGFIQSPFLDKTYYSGIMIDNQAGEVYVVPLGGSTATQFVPKLLFTFTPNSTGLDVGVFCNSNHDKYMAFNFGHQVFQGTVPAGYTAGLYS